MGCGFPRPIFFRKYKSPFGEAKEVFDFYWNRLYKGKSLQEAVDDKNHDLGVNAVGRQRGISGLYDGAQDACAEYGLKNLSFPKKYW